MNKIFKVKRNALNQTVVTSELAKNSGKLKSILFAASALTVVTPAFATENEAYSATNNNIVAGKTTEVFEVSTADVVFNPTQEQAESGDKAFVHSNPIEKTGKLSPHEFYVTSGGNKDNDKPKSVVSLDNLTLSLTEEVKNIDVITQPGFFGNTNIPAETTERYSGGLKASYGGKIAANNVKINIDTKSLTQNPQDKRIGDGLFNNPEIYNNAYLIGVLAGTEGSSQASDESSKIPNAKNEIVINGNYDFTAKRAFSGNEDSVSVPLIYGLQAIQNNDFGEAGLISKDSKKIEKVPTGLSPQSEVTVKGKYTADIEGANVYGVIVSGQKTASSPMPTVNLNDTDIAIKALNGSAIKVGASIHRESPQVIVSQIQPPSNALAPSVNGAMDISDLLGSIFGNNEGNFGDILNNIGGGSTSSPSDLVAVLEGMGYELSPEVKEALKKPTIDINNGGGAGQLNFKKDAKVSIKATGNNYFDAPIVVSHAGSTLNASEVNSFSITPTYFAIRTGDFGNNLNTASSFDGDITVNINNAKIEYSEVATASQFAPKPSIIFTDSHPNEHSKVTFTGDFNIKASEDGLLAYNPSGKLDLTLSGSGTATGAISQNSKILQKHDGSEKAFVGETKLVVKNGATWKLGDNEKAKFASDANPDVTTHISRLKEIILENGGILDAGVKENVRKDGDDPFHIKLEKIAAVNEKVNKTGTGQFSNNGGIINLANDNYNDELLIEGDYSSNGGKLQVNTLWNVDGTDAAENKSDKLIITGKVTGKTEVIPVSVDNTKQLIDGTIDGLEVYKSSPVVFLEDASNANDSFFSTTGVRTRNLTEVQLTSENVDIPGDPDGSQLKTIKRFYWTNVAKPEPSVVDSDVAPPVNIDIQSQATDSMDNTNTGNQPQPPVHQTGNTEIILSKTAPAYLLTNQNNLAVGKALIDTMHERRAGAVLNQPLWVRLVASQHKSSSLNRLESKNNFNIVQIAYDVLNHKNEDKQQFTTIFASLGKGNATFKDLRSSENGWLVGSRETGKTKSDYIAFGLGNSIFYKNNVYFDIYGQFNLLTNKYNSVNGVKAKNKGYGFGVSAEVGKAFNISEKFDVEIQGQLIAQRMNLGKIKDDVFESKKQTLTDLDSRLGLRAIYKPSLNTEIYSIVNLKQQLVNKVSNDFNFKVGKAKTRGEIGFGVNSNISKNLALYADVRLEKSLGGKSKHQNYKGNLGIKFQW
ncbi:autotransporter outer membrane beta-barrel domain-containing protein [Ursidibacter sp. B-7004-1]